MYNTYLVIGIIFFFIISTILAGLLMYILYSDQINNNISVKAIPLPNMLHIFKEAQTFCRNRLENIVY